MLLLLLLKGKVLGTEKMQLLAFMSKNESSVFLNLSPLGLE